MAGFCKTAVESSTTLKHYPPHQPLYQLRPSSGSPLPYSKFMPTSGFRSSRCALAGQFRKTDTLPKVISDGAPFHGSQASFRGLSPKQWQRKMSSYLPILGITEDTTPEILSWLQSLTDQLNKHFSTFAYLFGNRPSLADFSLAAPLFAHVWRDPGSRHYIETTQTS